MHIARVLTNETCNQNCTFCHARRPVEDRGFVSLAQVRVRLEQAAAHGGEVVLTGGEPTMRRDLAALISHARAKGAHSVTLETNATLVDATMARALRAAGLDRARIHLPRFDAQSDAVTRDPGGFAATLEGARSLADAGVALEASTPVVRSTAQGLASLPSQLAGSGLPFGALELNVPVVSPDAGELLGLDEAAACIAEAEATARTVGLVLRISADSPLPPCVFPQPARVAHLFSLTPGGRERAGFRQVSGCERCVVKDRCPGFPEAAPALPPRPLADDKVRRRLSAISTVQAQVERELQQEELYRIPGGLTVPARIVRINFHCNQACRFCFVSTHLPQAEDAAVERAITGIAEQGGVLVISGGEPTLNPRLLDYVKLARDRGASAIELQTNATRLADGDLAARLAASGVDHVFISLHGSTAEVCDDVTSAPGTFEKTVRGIDAAVAAGLQVRINFVFCQKNLHDFPAWVDLVGRRWPAVTAVVSFVAGSTDVVPRSEDLIPRYSEVLPFLSQGLQRARQLGVEVKGFESMCGVPLCLVPGDLAPYFELAELPGGFDRGEFVHPPACAGCQLQGRCFGLRRGYQELHGSGELSAVRA